MILLMVSGVFASTEISQEVKNFVDQIAEKKGIPQEKIKNIKEVDFKELPDQINLENIDETNIEVYEIQVEDQASVFAITAGDIKPAITQTKGTNILNFGFSGEMTESGFLKTATGVESSLDNGYVMIRDGSITGMSTSLEVLKGDSSKQIEIIIYKNGEEIGFGNTIEASSGVKKDFDTQSKGTVSFEAGDTISVYAKARGVVWKDVITMIETTSD